MEEKKHKDENGEFIWRTIFGRHIKIYTNMTLRESIKKSHKFSAASQKKAEKAYKKVAKVKAENILSMARLHEPKITKDLSDIVSRNKGDINYDAYDDKGNKHKALDFRLKGQESLENKIYDAINFNDDVKRATNITDAVRYTDMCGPDDIVSEYKNVTKELEDKGYKQVRCRNTFDNYSEKNPYRGINTLWEDPNGLVFELQYHTRESYDIKEKNHILYKKCENSSISEEEKNRLRLEMYNNSLKLKDIPGIGDIGSFDDKKDKRTTELKSDIKGKVTKQWIRNKLNEIQKLPEDDQTYNLNTKKPVDYNYGYQLSFEMVNDNYKDSQYMEQVRYVLRHAKDKNIYGGKFNGIAELSFRVDTYEEAMNIAKKYNQVSIWDWEISDTIQNPYYNKNGYKNKNQIKETKDERKNRKTYYK